MKMIKEKPDQKKKTMFTGGFQNCAFRSKINV